MSQGETSLKQEVSKLRAEVAKAKDDKNKVQCKYAVTASLHLNVTVTNRPICVTHCVHNSIGTDVY